MTRQSPNRNASRGFALIAVLWLVAAMSVLVGGIMLTVRGEPQHEPFDEVFFDAMLNIWLGPRAADPALKQALLGTDPYINRPTPTGNS